MILWKNMSSHNKQALFIRVWTFLFPWVGSFLKIKKQTKNRSEKNCQNRTMKSTPYFAECCCCLVAQSCPSLLQSHGLKPHWLPLLDFHDQSSLAWVATSYSRGSSAPRIDCVSCSASGFFTNWATEGASCCFQKSYGFTFLPTMFWDCLTGTFILKIFRGETSC